MQRWWAAPGCAGNLVDSHSFCEVMLSIVGISDLSVRAATGEGGRLLAGLCGFIAVHITISALNFPTRVRGFRREVSVSTSLFCGQ
jgi:hypothetical protein